MLDIAGLKYSSKQFDDYIHRAIVIVCKNDQEHVLHMYTTDTDKDNFIEVIKTSLKENVSFIKLDHWCTKTQDDLMSELIDESLKDI